MRNIAQGITLFNEKRFFEAHEAWEHEWRSAVDQSEKQFLQCLIMIAGALHHYTKREYAGALKLLSKCDALLKTLPAVDFGIDLEDLKGEVESFFRKLRGCTACVSEEDFPRIKGRSATKAA
jgi:predicted metal-dependent hydrolase